MERSGALGKDPVPNSGSRRVASSRYGFLMGVANCTVHCTSTVPYSYIIIRYHDTEFPRIFFLTSRVTLTVTSKIASSSCSDRAWLVLACALHCNQVHHEPPTLNLFREGSASYPAVASRVLQLTWISSCANVEALCVSSSLPFPAAHRLCGALRHSAREQDVQHAFVSPLRGAARP